MRHPASDDMGNFFQLSIKLRLPIVFSAMTSKIFTNRSRKHTTSILQAGASALPVLAKTRDQTISTIIKNIRSHTTLACRNGE
jgi:hypothetical protein